MKLDNHIKNWASLCESEDEDEKINEVSDVDVNWDDEDLQKSTDNLLDKQSQAKNRLIKLEGKEKEDLIYALVYNLAWLSYMHKDDNDMKMVLKDIEEGSPIWRDIPKKTRDDLLTTLNGTQDFTHQREIDDMVKSERDWE